MVLKKIRVGEDGWIYNPVGITKKERVWKAIKVGWDSFDKYKILLKEKG